MDGRQGSAAGGGCAGSLVGRGVPAEPIVPVFQTSCPLLHRLAGDGSPHQRALLSNQGAPKVEAEGRRGHKPEMHPPPGGGRFGVFPADGFW